MKIKCLWYLGESWAVLLGSHSAAFLLSQDGFLDLDQIIEICEDSEVQQVFCLWPFRPQRRGFASWGWHTKRNFKSALLPLILFTHLLKPPCNLRWLAGGGKSMRHVGHVGLKMQWQWLESLTAPLLITLVAAFPRAGSAHGSGL